MAVEIAQDVLALDDGSALRVGANLSTEVLEDSALRDTQSTGHFWQVFHVGLHTVESTLLSQLHLRHLVPVVGVVVLALRDANVGCHAGAP